MQVKWAEKAKTGLSGDEYHGEGDKVAVAYVHPAEVSTIFHLALLRLFLYDGATRQRITGGGAHISKFSSANISNARNDIVRDFLNTKSDWLWMIDADMDFEPTTLEQLLMNADPEKSPIVGALCFGVNHGNLFPTLYGLTKDDAGEVRAFRYDEYPENAMFQVAATGAACLLVHRTVLEQMRDAGFNKTYPWFQETELSGRPCGEDFTFCLRAGNLSIPVWVNTSVKIGHHKSQVLIADMYEKQLAEKHAAKTEKEVA
jgi:hypothetical protein